VGVPTVCYGRNQCGRRRWQSRLTTPKPGCFCDVLARGVEYLSLIPATCSALPLTILSLTGSRWRATFASLDQSGLNNVVLPGTAPQIAPLSPSAAALTSPISRAGCTLSVWWTKRRGRVGAACSVGASHKGKLKLCMRGWPGCVGLRPSRYSTLGPTLLCLSSYHSPLGALRALRYSQLPGQGQQSRAEVN